MTSLAMDLAGPHDLVSNQRMAATPTPMAAAIMRSSIHAGGSAGRLTSRLAAVEASSPHAAMIVNLTAVISHTGMR